MVLDLPPLRWGTLGLTDKIKIVMGIIGKAFKELNPERERLINELIDTIERNAVGNKATIENVELW